MMSLESSELTASNMADLEPLISLENVHFAYRAGTPVLRDVSFSLYRGQLTGLIGPNGAGKTTLVGLIRKALDPVGGSISFAGDYDNYNESPAVAVVEQHLSLFPDLSVAANICFGQWARGSVSWTSPKRLEAEAASMLHQFGIEVNVKRSARSLPYPTRQVAEIARAMYQGAKLLILDEPTAALDGQSRTRLLEILRALAAKGTAVLLVTHDMDDLRGVADRVLSIDEGRVNEGVTLEPDLIDNREPVSIPSQPSELKITVTLPAQKTIAVEGILGHTSVWHFEDAMERTLFARTLAFANPANTCRVDLGQRQFRNAEPAELRAHRIRLLLADRYENGIFPDLNVLQNYLLISGEASSEFWLDGQPRIRDVLLESEITFPSLDAPVSTLSGGNQQRLLWRAINDSSCDFIIAEEPLWGLDRVARRKALDLMAKINSTGRGVVVLTSFPRAYSGMQTNQLQRPN